MQQLSAYIIKKCYNIGENNIVISKNRNKLLGSLIYCNLVWFIIVMSYWSSHAGNIIYNPNIHRKLISAEKLDSYCSLCLPADFFKDFMSDLSPILIKKGYHPFYLNDENISIINPTINKDQLCPFGKRA